ncbi:MAG TPA: hypothetical protein VIG44_01290, partial [Thermomicrobiales bacterium]
PEINLAAETVGASDAARAIKGKRTIYLSEHGGFAPVPVYDRYALTPGTSFPGPAVVEERESTTIIGGGTVAVDTYRNLIVAMKGDAPRD